MWPKKKKKITINLPSLVCQIHKEMGFGPKCRHDRAGSGQRFIWRANSLVKGWIKRRISVQTDKPTPKRAQDNPKSKRKSKILEAKHREVKDGNTQT